MPSTIHLFPNSFSTVYPIENPITNPHPYPINMTFQTDKPSIHKSSPSFCGSICEPTSLHFFVKGTPHNLVFPM
ncbi:hypothetical protein E1A91_D10G156200v1 [Gossypium mustelinum]|uniref:Uncharacterized protein n=1 Tax=Gossypium mustelinum TaxID=34275 RepID=A0A5D2T7J3_GOSMU|nr:hypothetical protein E1A91_D10G156200v1 [Gossypium mustelinum]